MEIRDGGLRYIIRNNEALVISSDGITPKHLSIPEQIKGFPVTEIFQYAFQHSIIETVSIPDSVTKIGTGAFFFSESLQGVNILYNMHKKNKILVIEQLAFCACNQLSTFIVPDTILDLKDRVFVDCVNLHQLSGKIRMCETGALYNCTHLEKVVFADGADIKYNALGRNYNLQTIEFRGQTTIDENILKYIISNCKIFCTQTSNIADLAYEGYEIKIVR